MSAGIKMQDISFGWKLAAGGALVVLLAYAGYTLKESFPSVGDAIAPQGNSSLSLPKVFGGGGDPINVCVVTWGGYAGGEYFNGGFNASKESRYYKDYGITVNFRVMDDFVASRDAWKNGQCNLLWATIDAFTTEAANLQNAGFNPVFLFQADWSRGGDAIMAISSIRSMNDLRGKKIAVAFGTPSHTFLLRMLESAGMKISDVKLVDTGNAIDAAKMFQARQVDAAVVWSPDDEACLKAVGGSHILVNTKTASHIIADGFFVNRPYLESHRKELRWLVEGWMIGAAEINNNTDGAKEKAVSILASGLNIPTSEARKAIENVRLTTYGDNVAFFDLNGDSTGMTGERLFRESGLLYQANGYTDLVPSVPDWRSVVDFGLLREISLTGPMHAAEGGAKFSAPTRETAKAAAFATKQLSVHFATGSATLDENAKALIQDGFVPTARSFANARIRIEGNTDSVGSHDANVRLSRARAQAVANYLETFGFDRNRFVVVGNGPDNPVCNGDSAGCLAQNRRTDFELLND